MARTLERLVPDKRLVRLTVDLAKPIPFAGFSIEASVVRVGRTVATVTAAIVDEAGNRPASSTGLFVGPDAEHGGIPTHAEVHPAGPLGEAVPGPFPFTTSMHGLPAFNGAGVEMAYPPGETPEPGPTTLWMRTVPLLADEVPSPFQRICPLADCGNAFGRNAEPTEFSFINPDLTVVLHREPEGEWMGSSSSSHWHADGIGMADSLLFDTVGVVGRAIQTVIIR